MFRDPNKLHRPTEINEATATTIIVNAIEDFIGGPALNEEVAPDSPATIQAIKDLKALSGVLWDRYVRSGHWLELIAEIDRIIKAKNWQLENMAKLRAAAAEKAAAEKVAGEEAANEEAKTANKEKEIKYEEVYAS